MRKVCRSPALLVSAVFLLSGFLLSGCVDPAASARQEILLDSLGDVSELPDVGLTSDGAHPVCELNIDCVDPSAWVLYERLPTDQDTCKAAVALLQLISDDGVTVWAAPGQGQFADPETDVATQLENPSAVQATQSCVRAAERERGFLGYAQVDLETSEPVHARLVIEFEKESPRAVRDRIRLSYGCGASVCS